MEPEIPRSFQFGSYRIDPDEQLLRRDDQIVSLPPKALDLLLVLLANHGRVVSKRQLMDKVWPDSVVEEANLSHNIFLLRKSLGVDGKFIETVSKRGYRFAAEVLENSPVAAPVIVGRETVTRVSVEEEIYAPDAMARQFTDPVAKSSPRGKQSWLIASTALIIAVGGIGVASYLFLRTATPTPKKALSYLRITNSGRVACSSISPDAKFIAYAQNYTSGEGMVFARQTDTNREIKLIEPTTSVFGETGFSPDGQFVYYIAIDDKHPRGALYKVPVLGGISHLVIDNSGTRFTISSDGTQALLLRKNTDKTSESIIVANLNGSGETEVFTRPVSEMDIAGSLAWSPDKARIIFAADSERRPNKPYLDVKLHELDLNTRDLRTLSHEVWGEVGKMSWLADGRGVVFVGNRSRIGNQLYYYDVASSQVNRLTNGLQGFGNYGLGVSGDGRSLVVDVFEAKTQLWSVDASGDLSTSRQLTSGEIDGRYGLAGLSDGKIGFVSRAGSDLDIWTINEDGSDPKPITSDGVAEHDLAFAPDGQRMAFAADKGDGSHIFISDASGRNARQLTFGDSSDSRPDFSPDGLWVAYAAWRDGRSRLLKVSVTGGDPVELTDYDSTAPAFSPDGKMIAAILPGDSQAKPATIAVISSLDGSALKKFEVAQFEYDYRAPQWTPDGQGLVYWRDEKHVGNLWSQPVDGGEPVQLTRFTSDLIYNYTFSLDGRSIFLSRGLMQVNTVMIENPLDGVLN